MTKELILVTLEDLVGDFLYYDRKGDKELPRGAIEKAVKEGTISIEEMVAAFSKELRKTLKD